MSAGVTVSDETLSASEPARSPTSSVDRMRTSRAVLGAVNVTKRFGGVTAIRDVSFDVHSGEVHGLVGENGAGKSTLMKVLHGLYQPDDGHVELDGAPVELSSPKIAEGLGIAMIPQELELFPDLSVVENLYVGRERPRGRFGRYDDARMRRTAQEIFASLGVEIDVRAPTRHISVAARQLVAIGRALLGEAKVMIMDEPTAALTDREVERLFGIVADLQARGVGVVYISHRLGEIRQLADRVTVMRDGQHIATRPKLEMSTEQMVALMVGRELSHGYERERAPRSTVALEVSNLSRAGDFHDIGFALHEGEVLGVAGLIGAGRTELAQALAGLRTPDAGEIRVAGTEARITQPRHARDQSIAYVPEERRAQGLFLPMSIGKNIAFASLPTLSPHGFVRRRREAALSRLLADQLGVRGAELDAPVARLSGGNQQKVLLAKYLALEPRVLILDEPTRGVDVGAKAEIYGLIDELARAGTAILLISSELEEVLALSDRVLVMREGELVSEMSHVDATPERIGAAAAGVAHHAPPDTSDEARA